MMVILLTSHELAVLMLENVKERSSIMQDYKVVDASAVLEAIEANRKWNSLFSTLEALPEDKWIEIPHNGEPASRVGQSIRRAAQERNLPFTIALRSKNPLLFVGKRSKDSVCHVCGAEKGGAK